MSAGRTPDATTTGIIVRGGPPPTDSRVGYGAAPGSLGSTADDATVTTEHVVPVGGLSPDTRYYYSVGSAGAAFVGDDADHFFRTPPTPGTPKPTHIWVTGDGGFVNADGFAVRDAFATWNAGQETDMWAARRHAYSSQRLRLPGAPVQHAHECCARCPPGRVGNHEASPRLITARGRTSTCFRCRGVRQRGLFGRERLLFDYGNIHSSCRRAGSSRLREPSCLGRGDLHSARRLGVAFWHQPPYSKGALHDSDVEAREIQMRANVLPVLEDYGVDLVLCGHSHSYERSHLIDGHYGLSGTLVGTMVLDSGDGRPTGDGPYRKEGVGPTPHEGAVFVVAGSSSEVRTATLNHPLMEDRLSSSARSC